MGFNDLHACVRVVMRRSELVDFYHTDAQMKYLCDVTLNPVATELETTLCQHYGFTLTAAFDVIERVLMECLPTRESLVEADQAHARLVRQLERGISDNYWKNDQRAQEGTTDVQTH